MIEIPWLCSACGHENMVDFEHLTQRPTDQIVSQEGFVCSKCGEWEAVSYTNASVKEAVDKLTRYPPGHRKFQFLFAKALKKVESVQEKGRGTSKNQDLAKS